MPHQVIFKKSSVAAKVPLTTDLAYGEVAINYTDGKLYYKTNTNAIKYFVTYDDSVITSKAPLDSPVFTGSPAAPTPSVLATDTQIATARYVKNLFGAGSTSGTLDWNDVSNTRPGGGPTLLLGSATNGPGGADYYHAFNIEYNSKDGTGNVTQMAISYGNTGNTIWMRGRYNSVWTAWVRFINSSSIGSYAPTLTGTGATGSWNINSATATALQTTRLINGSSFNGTANITISEPTFFGGLSAYTTTTPDTVPTNGGFTVRYLSSGATNKPTGTDHSLLTMAYSSAWATQIAGDWRTNEFYVRGNNNGTWSAWDKLYRTNDAATAETASKLALRDSNGDLTTRRFISTIATGTSPLGVTSTTVVTNLNADMLDGQHASAFQTALVSGTNIKTINGATLLGAGDIPVATISDAMAIAIALG
jgi:hypothetical protein